MPTFISPLSPPANEPLTDGAGNTSRAWLAWFQMLADRMGARSSGLARTGSATSDGASVISGTFDPPFTVAPTISLYDAAGTLRALTNVTADAAGFNGTAPLPGTVYNWVATG